MSIPEKAIEAAAKEKYGHPWDRAPQWAKDEERRVAREMLEVAAPFIAAQAWDQGYDVGRNDGWHDARDHTPNPYRA